MQQQQQQQQQQGRAAQRVCRALSVPVGALRLLGCLTLLLQ
jgi:hypothetical protein